MRLAKLVLPFVILALSATAATAGPPGVRIVYPGRPVPVYPVRPSYSPLVVQVPTTLTLRPSYPPPLYVTRPYAVYFRAYPVDPWVYYGSYSSLRHAEFVREELMFSAGYQAIIR